MSGQAICAAIRLAEVNNMSYIIIYVNSVLFFFFFFLFSFTTIPWEVFVPFQDSPHNLKPLQHYLQMLSELAQ